MTRSEAIDELKYLAACSYVDEFELTEKEALKMAIEALKQKTSITPEELENIKNITIWIKDNIMRNNKIMFDATIRGDDGYQDIDLIEVIASLHNMLYKEVTGEYYDYMFHWANKVGSWVYDDMFKKEDEKRERY